MNEQNPAQAQNHSLSFTKLTAMIIGSTIGGGIFTTAGDMAASGAHTGSVLIGWAICGIGMFCPKKHIIRQNMPMPQCPHRLGHLRHRHVLPDDVLLRAQPRAP